MDCDSLIDFNSPLKKGCNMLDPLVPLPQSQSNNVNGNIASTAVGDNPFDNLILQICKLDDPFEVTEKEALQRSRKNYQVQKQTTWQEQTTKDESNIEKEEIDNSLKNVNTSKCDSPQLKSSSQLDVSNTKPCFASDSGHISLNEKSLSESYLSPINGKIENKFSKLYLSVQLDKQLLDESSRCIHSGDQDISLLNVSKTDAFDRSRRSPSPMSIPKGTNEVKAFVANRIEKCIEKALNESRKSVNCSFRHRRSLSAASLYSNPVSQENLYNYSSLKPSYDSSSIASKYRPRSVSKPDLHSSLNTNVWGSQHNVFDFYTGSETLANISNRFNTAFRKNTATSSMYSSYGEGNTGFRKSFTSLSSYRPSNSSVVNISSSEINGEDSVFLKDDIVIMGGKSSTCVFMEAKNLSCILQRRSRAEDDEPIDADLNFLTDDNFRVELVESDTSCSEDDVKGKYPEQTKEKQSSSGNKDWVKSGSNNNEHGISEDTEEPCLPLSRDKIAGMGLRSKVLQPKKPPILVPLPPVPLPSTSNNGNLVLKPKSQSESKVGKRGPMKAMIPVGNMMRHEVKKENAVPLKQAVGRPNKSNAKSLSSASNLRKSVLTGDNSQKDKALPPTTSLGSPSDADCGRPIACSTPDGVLPLVSPVLSLQVSHIAKETPVDGGHRRSKSSRVTDSGRPETESQLTNTPTRKPARHARSKSGLSKSGLTNTSLPKTKQQSPDPISPLCTSTPLKSLTKNSPSLNRVKKPTPVNRKLLQKENSQVEKENLKPHVEQKQRPVWRSSTRRMEV